MDGSEWWQLVSGIAFYRSLWFLVYLVVPLVVAGIMCLLARKKSVASNGAWNAVGRTWAGIGWAGIIASVVLYLGAALWWVPNVPVVKRLPVEKKQTMQQAYVGQQTRFFKTKSNDKTVVFVRDYYAWFHALPVTVGMIGLVFWLFFLRPGNKMAREEIDLLSAEEQEKF